MKCAGDVAKGYVLAWDVAPGTQDFGGGSSKFAEEF